jgi:hypothetical protein
MSNSIRSTLVVCAVFGFSASFPALSHGQCMKGQGGTGGSTMTGAAGRSTMQGLPSTTSLAMQRQLLQSLGYQQLQQQQALQLMLVQQQQAVQALIFQQQVQQLSLQVLQAQMTQLPAATLLQAMTSPNAYVRSAAALEVARRGTNP